MNQSIAVSINSELKVYSISLGIIQEGSTFSTKNIDDIGVTKVGQIQKSNLPPTKAYRFSYETP